MDDLATIKNRIFDILDSKTDVIETDTVPSSESSFTYENGIRTWVAAVFIDMRHSSDFFTKNNADVVARIMRAYCSEIINILRQNSNYREIGIRGDCVYAIYTSPTKDSLNQIYDDAVIINSFHKLFQKILLKKGYPTFSVGIGLGADKDLVIKVGQPYSGINDLIWIGNAVIDASNLSNKGDTSGLYSIYMNSCFYSNIKDYVANYETGEKNSDQIHYINGIGYATDVVKINIDNWIKENI